MNAPYQKQDDCPEMTPAELDAIGTELYGAYGWQTKLAEALDIAGSLVRRWKMTADKPSSVPIPPKRADQIRRLLAKHRNQEVTKLSAAGVISGESRRAAAYRKLLMLMASV